MLVDQWLIMLVVADRLDRELQGDSPRKRASDDQRDCYDSLSFGDNKTIDRMKVETKTSETSNNSVLYSNGFSGTV